MLLSVSADVLLYILSFLSVHDLGSFSLISRQARTLIAENEDTVYHQAALFHHLAQPGVTIDDLRSSEGLNVDGGAWLKHVHTWKELCKRYLLFPHTFPRILNHSGSYVR